MYTTGCPGMTETPYTSDGGTDIVKARQPLYRVELVEIRCWYTWRGVIAGRSQYRKTHGSTKACPVTQREAYCRRAAPKKAKKRMIILAFL